MVAETGIIPSFNEKKWKCTFKLTRDLTDQEMEDQVQAESCKVQVKFVKMDEDSNLICIDFTRLEGSALYFYE